MADQEQENRDGPSEGTFEVGFQHQPFWVAPEKQVSISTILPSLSNGICQTRSTWELPV